ncbi:MAG: restriction endonuclease [Bellilinea sp.]
MEMKNLQKQLSISPMIPELHYKLAIIILKNYVQDYYEPERRSSSDKISTTTDLTSSAANLKEILRYKDFHKIIFIAEKWPVLSDNMDFSPWYCGRVDQHQYSETFYDGFFDYKRFILPIKQYSQSHYLDDKPELSKARDELQIALALGLSDKLTSAKIRLLLTKVIGTIMVHEDNHLIWYHKKYQYHGFDPISIPELKELVLSHIKDLKLFLRQWPHNFEALNLLITAYKTTKNKAELGKAIQTLNQVESLVNAKMIPVEETVSSVDFTNVVQSQSTPVARKNTGLDFEVKVQMLLESMGFTASTTKITGDGGIDIVAFHNSPIIKGKYILQCKDWTHPVGEPALRDLYGLVLSEGANKGILITSGKFSAAAEKFSVGKPLELIDGEELNKIINDSRKSRKE